MLKDTDKIGHFRRAANRPSLNLSFGSRSFPPVMLDPLVCRARAAAVRDFNGKTRKVPKGSGLIAAPYVLHPHAVALRLARAGFDAEVVAAGYLHDHPEDLPHLWNTARIAREFTPRVAALVDWVSEQDKSLPWEARKSAYAERLRHAPREAVAISIADKTCNLLDSIAHLRNGYAVESVLSRDWLTTSKRFHQLFPLFVRSGSMRLIRDFIAALAEFDRIGAEPRTANGPSRIFGSN